MLGPLWAKSLHSNGNGGNNCVEVRALHQPGADPVVQVRHSGFDPTHLVLTFTADEWLAFIDGVADGEFNL
jgi:hypothetical protein